jgi:hypothetical protein
MRATNPKAYNIVWNEARNARKKLTSSRAKYDEQRSQEKNDPNFTNTAVGDTRLDILQRDRLDFKKAIQELRIFTQANSNRSKVASNQPLETPKEASGKPFHSSKSALTPKTVSSRLSTSRFDNEAKRKSFRDSLTDMQKHDFFNRLLAEDRKDINGDRAGKYARIRKAMGLKKTAEYPKK